MSEIPEYLTNPEFQPQKLKINELISIMSQHGIDLPSVRQRKEFYVNHFRNELQLDSRRIIEKYYNAAPRADDIIKVSKIPVDKENIQPKISTKIKKHAVFTDNFKSLKENRVKIRKLAELTSPNIPTPTKFDVVKDKNRSPIKSPDVKHSLEIIRKQSKRNTGSFDLVLKNRDKVDIFELPSPKDSQVENCIPFNEKELDDQYLNRVDAFVESNLSADSSILSPNSKLQKSFSNASTQTEIFIQQALHYHILDLLVVLIIVGSWAIYYEL